jgi:hypothetical protein
MAAPDDLTKLHISHALGQRSTRVAVLIAESLVLGFDLLEEQPTTVVEAMIDYWKDKGRKEPQSVRYELRKAIIKYAEETLERAKTRDRRLLQGITGVEPEDNNDSR